MSAGDELRAAWDAELAAHDPALEWDPAEAHHLDAAARAADRAAALRAAFAVELAGEQRPGELVKLSAELRALDKAVGDHLGRLQVGDGLAKSKQHQAAVNARWDRVRAERGQARRQAGY